MSRPAPGAEFAQQRTVPVSGTTYAAQRPVQRLDHHYLPTLEQLHPGPANRYILALRSGVPSEVDWALPRLVTASYEYGDRFNVSAWTDAASALMDWPELWLEDLRQKAALEQARRDGAIGEVMGSVPSWTANPATERRATESLLIMRNASCSLANAKHMARPQLINFLYGFFDLPHEVILDTLLQSPEPVLHLLVILQSTLPYMTRNAQLDSLFLIDLPAILLDTRDAAVLTLLIPLIIAYLTILGKQAPPHLPARLPIHLVHLLALSPPSPIFEYTLDLLVALTIHSAPSLGILSDSGIAGHLKTLARVLEHGAVQRTTEMSVPVWSMGGIAPNPASTITLVEDASKRRAAARAEAHAIFLQTGHIPSFPDLGIRPPQIDSHLRRKLMVMKEPDRSIAWMHESFVYSAEGQVLQVDFWHAYREFFTTDDRVEPMLTAAEMIKNVALAFPGTGAKVMMGPNGVQKFVIAGLGFRKDVPDVNRNICRWDGCQARGPYPALLTLIEHVRTHLLTSPDRCHWSACKSPTCTLSHMLTHLPLPPMPGTPPAPPTVLSNPRSDSWISHFRITGRSAPRLPPAYKIKFENSFTPMDEQSLTPRGAPFLAALLLRNLARSLRNEMDAAADRAALLAGPGEMEMDVEGNEEQAESAKKRQAEARYGLPIPDSVLEEEEEEARAVLKSTLNGKGDGEGLKGGLGDEERERARSGFMAIEERIGEVVVVNRGGIGQYLGECWGW